MRNGILIPLFCLALAACTKMQGDVNNSMSTEARFRDFSAVVQGDPTKPLWDHALSWNRLDLPWAWLEPEPGRWGEKPLVDFGQRALDHDKRNAMILPILDYNVVWAADRSDRTFEHGKWRWRYKPRDDGKFDVIAFEQQTDGTWQKASQAVTEPNQAWPIAADHVDDWTQFIRRAVKFLRADPYNVEYFQIWNEAHPTSGFYHGDLDTYMQRVHLPAAKVIHAEGGKVVYGGWPCCGTLQQYVDLLDRHDAWDSIDVLDVHYFPVAAWPFLYKAAQQRGHHDKFIWQTEIGFTTDPGFIPNTYPRILHWALQNEWNHPDRYKSFYFAQWSPNDPKAFGYRHCLYLGDELSPHGRSLQTLGNLLDGIGLRKYSPVVTDPTLTAEINEQLSSIEAFAVDQRIVIAIHLTANNVSALFVDWNKTGDTIHLRHGDPSITVTLPRLDPDQVKQVQRCDLAGRRLDLTPAMKAASDGQGLSIAVPVRDATDSPAREWNRQTSQPVTFFLLLRLKPSD